MATQIAIRRDSLANWTSVNPVLGDGEPAFDESGGILRIGDGITKFLDLPTIGGEQKGNIVPVITGLEARPNFPIVIWYGGQIQPTNMTLADLWFASSSTIVDTAPPTAPTDLAASGITGAGFTLGWTPATDNVGVNLYDVQIAGVTVATSTSPFATITGLAPGSNYSVQVRARDAAGNWSALSSALSVTTLSTGDLVAPTVPTGVAASSTTSTTTTISWTASTDAVGVTGYDVQFNGISKGTPTGTSLAVTGLTASTAYTVRVRARDAAGNWSSLSTAITVTTIAGGVKATHSVFPATPTQPLAKFNDGGTLRVVNAFYTYGTETAGWKVKGMRVYLPSGASIPAGGNAYLDIPAAGTVPDLVSPDQSVALPNLVAGQWNSVNFTTPVVVTAGQLIYVGYETSDGSYIYATSAAMGGGFITAADGSKVVFAEENVLSGGVTLTRSYYRANGGSTQSSNNVSYGIDIIVEEA